MYIFDLNSSTPPWETDIQVYLIAHGSHSKCQEGNSRSPHATPCDGDAGVEGERINLTLLMVFFVARGFATWLSRKLEVPTQSLRVSVGTDSRISGLAVRCASLRNNCLTWYMQAI